MRTVPLNSLVVDGAPIIYGILMPGSHVDEGVPVVKVRNLDNGRIDLSSLLRTTAEIDAMYRRSKLRSGDVLLSIRGTAGLVAIVPPELDGGNITQDSARIRVSDRSVRDYLVHALQSPFVQRQIALHTVGQAVKGINIASVRVLEIPLPKEAKRRDAITRLFRVIDQMQHGVEDGTRAKRRFKQALMQQLLTGIRRFAEFRTDPWTRREISRVGRVTSGATPSTVIAENWDGGVPWCTPTDITALRGPWLRETSRTISATGLASCAAELLPSGSVVVCTRATIGNAAITEVPLATNQGFKSIIPNEDMNSAFIYYAVLHAKRDLLRHGAGSTFAEVSKSSFESILLPAPSKPEQERVAAVLLTLDQELELLDRQLESLRRLKRGLMQKLLTGDLEPPRTNSTEPKEVHS